MNKLKWLTLMTALMVTSITTVSFANDNPPISKCTRYLNYSDSQFNALLSGNQGVAKSVANALSACQIANVCSHVTGIDHCAVTLANRSFTSEYYANFNGQMALQNPFAQTQSNSTASTAPSATTQQQQQAIIVPNPSSSPNTNTNRTRTNNNNANSSRKNNQSNSSSSIHWF